MKEIICFSIESTSNTIGEGKILSEAKVKYFLLNVLLNKTHKVKFK